MGAERIGGDPWESATWDGAESAMLAVGAGMTVAERLRWLEEAARVARAFAQAGGGAARISEVAEGQPPTDRSRL